jgi:hypothetical protein
VKRLQPVLLALLAFCAASAAFAARVALAIGLCNLWDSVIRPWWRTRAAHAPPTEAWDQHSASPPPADGSPYGTLLGRASLVTQRSQRPLHEHPLLSR